MPVGHLSLVNAPGPVAFPAARDAHGNTRTANGFGDYGIPDDYVGPMFDPSALYFSPRAGELEFRASYFHCKQHDHKSFRWDGTGIGGPSQIRTTQPMIGSQAPSHYVPLNQRRPSAPYRIGRKQVSAFTGMLFGEGRWPQLRSKDPETQAAAEALAEACQLSLQFIHGRNLGGSSGTVGFSWCFVDGLPRVRPHRGSRIHVLSWADEDAHIPAHVLELKQVTQVAPDPKDGKLRPMQFWQRRDWTLVADIVFKPCLVDSDGLPIWQIDESLSRVHGDGECHFVWALNLPSEDETEDGACDYGETYEQMDGLDELNSVHVNGTKLNLDPTLLLKLDPSDREGTGVIKKGTDNAIVTGITGDAKYLQLADTQLGEQTINLQRAQILEANECVVLDPDKAAAAAASGEAQKIVYAPMIARCDVLRLQWGPSIARLVNQMLRSWRRLKATPVVVPANDVDVPLDEDGSPLDAEPEALLEEADQDLALPVRTLRRPKPDGSGGEEEYDVPHVPGTGLVTVEWGPYFKPSGQEKQAITTSLVDAVGGKPILSQRAGVELVSNLYDRDATDEWESIQAEEKARRDLDVGDFSGDTGGEVSADTTPDGGVEIAPTDAVKVLSVNEVRGILHQGPLLLPDGTPDPDGLLSVSAYDAKMQAQQAVEGEAEGADNAGVPPVADDALPVAPSTPLGFGGE